MAQQGAVICQVLFRIEGSRAKIFGGFGSLNTAVSLEIVSFTRFPVAVGHQSLHSDGIPLPLLVT